MLKFRGLLDKGSECANIAIRNWPFHIMTEQIGQLIKNAIVLEAYWDAEHNINRFQECKFPYSSITWKFKCA